MTNTVEHTPGPWINHGCTVYQCESWKDGNDLGSRFIGSIYSPESEDPPTDEDEANARLIAAAPELLAACEMMLPLFEEYVIEHESPKFKGSRNFVADARAQLNGFQAAITKAKGQP